VNVYDSRPTSRKTARGGRREDAPCAASSPRGAHRPKNNDPPGGGRREDRSHSFVGLTPEARRAQ